MGIQKDRSGVRRGEKLQCAAVFMKQELAQSQATSFRNALVIFLICLHLLASSAQGQQQKTSGELTLAAAADLSAALKEIGDSYERKTGLRLKVSLGSSGMLTQEIQNGAPFDIFLSADMDYPRQLIAAGAAEANSLAQYAVGKLALWVPSDSRLDLQHQGMNVLLDPAVKKIAIANPQHAPYGRAAVAALKHAGLYDRVSNRLVMGESVAQAAQFVESGNAQAGFVALAHAVAPGMQGKGRYHEIPSDAYPPLAQGAVVLTHSQRKEQAMAFLRYLQSNEATDILRKYGFTK